VALPTPVPGLVISFSFLWSHEHEGGAEEGNKTRPCTIVVAAETGEAGETEVIVAPMTTRPPESPELAVEVPPRVRNHLGLGTDRCWIICSELNRFVWPGYDLAAIPGQPGRFDHGMLPRRLFEPVSSAIDHGLFRPGTASSGLVPTGILMKAGNAPKLTSGGSLSKVWNIPWPCENSRSDRWI